VVVTTFSRRSFLAAAGAALASAGLARAGWARGMAASSASGFAMAWAMPRSVEEWALLGTFDLTHRGGGGGAEVLLWPGDLARLQKTGIAFDLTVDDVVARDRAVPAVSRPYALAAQPGERNDYRRLADYEADLRRLVADRPGLSRLITLPLASWEGRRILGIEIAENVGRPDGRPTFYMDGIHHAREWPSGEMPIMFAEDLVRSFGNDPRVTRLLRSVRVVIVPVVNVDGFVWSREFPYDTSSFAAYGLQAVGFGSYWRKNRRDLTDDLDVPVEPGLTAYGVDNNRNYPLGWGGAGTGRTPLELTWEGDAPFSEPESRNVGSVVLSRTVTGVISNHTYSDLVLRPWGDTRVNCPDEDLLAGLGEAMAVRNEYKNIKGIDLYPTTGTMSDWAYGAVGALAYTFEHGKSNFHPPYAGFIPELYAKNREPFLIAAEGAADPAHHSVIRGTTVVNGRAQAAAVRVRRAVDLATNGGEHNDTFEVAVSSDAAGRFSVHLGPSTPPKADSPVPYEVIIGKARLQVVVRRGQVVELGRVSA
jgi:hypothetical protein